jgi:hypothetical protein
VLTTKEEQDRSGRMPDRRGHCSYGLCPLTLAPSYKAANFQSYSQSSWIQTKQLVYVSGSPFRTMALFYHIFQARPELPRLPPQGFEAEDNVLSRMI